MLLFTVPQEISRIASIAQSLARLTVSGLLLAGLFVLTPSAQAYQINNRWTSTATDGNTGLRGDSITLTWGFVADGTTITGGVSGEPTSGSTLISFMDTNFGAGLGGPDLTERPWFWIFEQSYTRIGELSGVTFVYEPNNSSQAINSNPIPVGQLGVRPDIRIGGHSVDGSTGPNSVAYSYFPNNSDLVIDTDNAALLIRTASNYRTFRNVLMHESGHGLGINHMSSNNARFLLEPRIDINFDGPQLDDILALHRNYGDAFEKNAGNDTFANATLLGSLLNGETLSIGTLGNSTLVAETDIDFVSIDGVSDVDFFSFTLTRTLDVSLNLTPRGATYNQGPEGGTQTSLNTSMLSDLTLALLDTGGTALLDTANLNGIGLTESISRLLAPGTYFARITGANDDVQLYGLDILGTRVATELFWTGQQSDVWDIDTTDNFADSVGPVAFYNQDQVTFDDTASTFAVNLAENVQPASITVDTAGTYNFSGPGGILSGSLTLTGGGTLELANDGNSYEGLTDVQAGTLIIISSTGFGDTTVQSGAVVAGGGTVGGDLIAMDGATVQPGEHLSPSITAIEQGPTLTVDGDLTQQMGAALQVQLRDALDYGSLLVAGIALLEGTLDVQLAEDFTASLGDRFDVLTALGGVEGIFTQTILPAFDPLLALNVFYDLNTVSLAVVPALPGDFNVDGIVDGLDFLAWQRGLSPSPLSAEDLADWQMNYGSEMLLSTLRVSPSALQAAVPEPSTGIIVFLAMLGLMSRRGVGRNKPCAVPAVTPLCQ